MESGRTAVMFVHGLPMWRDPVRGWVDLLPIGGDRGRGRAGVLRLLALDRAGRAAATSWAGRRPAGPGVPHRLRAHSGGVRSPRGHRPQSRVLPRHAGLGRARPDDGRIPRRHLLRVDRPPRLRLGEHHPPRPDSRPLPSQRGRAPRLAAPLGTTSWGARATRMVRPGSRDSGAGRAPAVDRSSLRRGHRRAGTRPLLPGRLASVPRAHGPRAGGPAWTTVASGSSRRAPGRAEARRHHFVTRNAARMVDPADRAPRRRVVRALLAHGGAS